MYIQEYREIKEGKLDNIPLIGRWLSKKLGLVTYEPQIEFVVDFGDNGEIRLKTEDEFASEEKKREVVGNLVQSIMQGDEDEGEVNLWGYDFQFKKDLNLWS